MPQPDRLSPRAAFVVGSGVAAVGVFIVLLALGVVGPPRLSPGTPPWVGVLAGLVFVLGGLAVVVGYGVAGGAAPDGDLPAGTPFGVRLVQYLLGLGMSVALALIMTWVAVGPGPRTFRGTGTIGGAADETLGRVVFGIGALLTWAVTALMAAVNLERLRRALAGPSRVARGTAIGQTVGPWPTSACSCPRARRSSRRSGPSARGPRTSCRGARSAG